MSDYIIFYLFFAAQVALLSIYFPYLMLKRMRKIYTDYPPSEYPKLYPSGKAELSRAHHIFEAANILVVFLAIAMIVWIELFTDPSIERVLDELSVIFFVVQLGPMVILEISAKSELKAMRLLNKNRKRSAELQPRKVTDFASVKLITLTISMIILSIIVDILVNQHIHQFQFSWDNSTVHRSIVMIVTNALLATVGYFNIYSKKLDPHQDTNDRNHQIGLAIRSLFYVSIGMSIFFMVKEGTDDLGIDHLQPAMTALYCTLIGFFSIGSRVISIKLKDINFDVYKEDATSPHN